MIEIPRFESEDEERLFGQHMIALISWKEQNK